MQATRKRISEPQIVSYNKTQAILETKSRENEAGPEVIHVYAVGNRGPSTVKEAAIDILWPTFTLQNRPLLYLMEQPQIIGNGRCKEVRDVNPYFLKKEKKPRSHGYSVNIVSGSVEHVFGENKDQEKKSKREVPLKLWLGNNTAEEMACGPSRCTKIACTVYDLAKDEQVVFTIRSRLWKDTLIEMGLDEVQISSKLVSRVTSLPHEVDPSYLGTKAFFVTTKVNPEISSFKLRLIPWWLVILSITAGLILLGLLALFLWWAGFFRRRRPQDQMEEPLHFPYRNGYHMAHNDEYL